MYCVRGPGMRWLNSLLRLKSRLGPCCVPFGGLWVRISFQAHSGYWSNSVLCGFRTDWGTFPLAVARVCSQVLKSCTFIGTCPSQSSCPEMENLSDIKCLSQFESLSVATAQSLLSTWLIRVGLPKKIYS